jgi:hypothetical protein
MLVLSRKVGQQIVAPDLDLAIKVVVIEHDGIYRGRSPAYSDGRSRMRPA